MTLHNPLLLFGTSVARRRFNSRAREGRDVISPDARMQRPVSIHAPARGATIASAFSRASAGFNSRAREGRDNRLVSVRRREWFQFTRPRGARHSLSGNHPLRIVSIHAPARGATHHASLVVRELRVSIHAPARGATGNASLQSGMERFNSRARERRDGRL